MNARRVFLGILSMLSLLFAPASPARAARMEAASGVQGGSLYWTTFQGGDGWDHGTGIAVGADGNIYVSGSSEQGWGSPVSAFQGYWDAYAAKLGPNGTLLWHTFLGSNDEDYAGGIAVDVSGNIYVVGTSNQTWGNPVNPFVGGPVYNDVFVAKLDNSGTLVWNTFLGGPSEEQGLGIGVDANGNAYVTGTSWSTWGTPVRAFTGTVSNGFAARLDANGALVWNTFLGGGQDLGAAIALDGSQDLYVVGASADTWGAPVRAFTGTAPFTDAFAARLQSSDGALVWNTFLGGEQNEAGLSIAPDGSGNLYVAGWSEGTWGSPVRAYSANTDAFAARLDDAGALAWNTFLGGSGSDYGTGLALDGAGNILAIGQSEASWGAPLRRFTAGTDAFAARLSPAGARVWNTFLGGPGFDQAWGIAVDARRNAYLTGGSDGGWGSPIDPYAASRDMFVAKLGMAGSFRSAAAEDGWVLESAEGSNQGGTMNTAASGFNVGDDASDRQYRAGLSFDTAGLPDNAVITKVTVQVKRQGITGDNPFNTHGGLKVDIRAPYFGTSAALAPGDFQAAASRGSVGTFNKVPAAGAWYSAVLGQSAYAYINRKGTTQLRLRFSLDDNDDMSADYIRFYSGNAGSLSYRPVLTVEYYTP